MYFRPPSRQALPFLVSLFDSEAYELYSTASGFGVVKKTGSSAAATASPWGEPCTGFMKSLSQNLGT